jgi:8-oxo-dGTP pyrophosphatase MutT (NUDIX family)
MSWKQISSKIAHQNPWYRVREDSVVRPDGTPGKYFITEMQHPGVAIIPFDGTLYYLVEQYRYTIDRRVWAFPAGHGEGVDLNKDAARELLEETGFSANKWTKLGTIVLAPGWSSAEITVFLAEELTRSLPQRENSEQDMRMEGFTSEQITELITNTTVHDALLLNALPLLQLYRRKSLNI